VSPPSTPVCPLSFSSYIILTPSWITEKLQECLRAATYMRKLLIQDLKPRDILTKKSFENAIVLMNILGGSTNSVLHLLAIARSADIDLSIDDFQAIANKTPYICNLKPSGDWKMEGTSHFSPPRLSLTWYRRTDLHKVGGIPSIVKYLLKTTDLIDGSQLTVTGLTLAENVADAPNFDFTSQVRPPSLPPFLSLKTGNSRTSSDPSRTPSRVQDTSISSVGTSLPTRASPRSHRRKGPTSRELQNASIPRLSFIPPSRGEISRLVRLSC
jgi:hypothetical protein